MKKLIIIGTVLLILGGVIFIMWTLLSGFGFLKERVPQWFAEGEKMLTGGIKKAEEFVPDIKEKVKGVVPGLTEKVKDLALPEKDVSGEDIKGIPRYPNMIRASYEIKDKKRTVVYKGKVDFRSVLEFFNKEMATLGFKKKVIFASPEEEIHRYRKPKRELEFSFKKTGIPGLTITELTIKEIE
jgi:hypothetical protein